MYGADREPFAKRGRFDYDDPLLDRVSFIFAISYKECTFHQSSWSGVGSHMGTLVFFLPFFPIIFQSIPLVSLFLFAFLVSSVYLTEQPSDFNYGYFTCLARMDFIFYLNICFVFVLIWGCFCSFFTTGQDAIYSLTHFILFVFDFKICCSRFCILFNFKLIALLPQAYLMDDLRRPFDPYRLPPDPYRRDLYPDRRNPLYDLRDPFLPPLSSLGRRDPYDRFVQYKMGMYNRNVFTVLPCSWHFPNILHNYLPSSTTNIEDGTL